MNELSMEEFDYSLLSGELAEKIKEKDYILIGLHSKYSEEVGKVLYEAQQDFSDYNNGGLFEKWYTSRGFKKQNVYNYINIYNEVQNLDGDKLEVFQELPKSLQIEVSKKSVDSELKEQVYNGEIKTHQEYRKMLEERNLALEKLKRFEQQAQTERKERERLEQENEELANREPEKVEILVEDEIKIKNLYSEIKKHQQKISELEENQERSKGDLEEFNRLKDQINSLYTEKDDVIRQIESAGTIGKFIAKVERSFQNDLAPIKYTRAIRESAENEAVINAVNEIIEMVEDWIDEIRKEVPHKKWEVIDHE